MPEWKKPESFQQVIKIIVRAIMHIENVQKCSTSDTLGGGGDEKSTMSGRGEEDIFTKAVHFISSILHEPSEVFGGRV